MSELVPLFVRSHNFREQLPVIWKHKHGAYFLIKPLLSAKKLLSAPFWQETLITMSIIGTNPSYKVSWIQIRVCSYGKSFCYCFLAMG